MIDFLNTTGKNKGKVQNEKLAAYFNMSEGGIRAIKKKCEKRFDITYLGSFCHANNIKIEELREFAIKKDKENEIKSFDDALDWKPAAYGFLQAKYLNYYLIDLNQYDRVYDIRTINSLKNLKSRITKEEMIEYFKKTHQEKGN